jgi:hypothetical protein
MSRKWLSCKRFCACCQWLPCVCLNAFFHFLCLNNLKYRTLHHYVMYSKCMTPLSETNWNSWSLNRHNRRFKILKISEHLFQTCWQVTALIVLGTFQQTLLKCLDLVPESSREDVQLIFKMDTLGRISVKMLHNNKTAPICPTSMSTELVRTPTLPEHAWTNIWIFVDSFVCCPSFIVAFSRLTCHEVSL